MRFKIFDHYFLVVDFNSHAISIISVKRRDEKVLRPTVRENNSYYSFYQNGIKKELSLREIVEMTLSHSVH